MIRIGPYRYFILVVALIATAVLGQTPDSGVSSDADIQIIVREAMDAGGGAPAISQTILSQCYLHFGTVDSALEHLIELETAAKSGKADFKRIRAGILRIRGDRQDARQAFLSIEKPDQTIADRLALLSCSTAKVRQQRRPKPTSQSSQR